MNISQAIKFYLDLHFAIIPAYYGEKRPSVEWKKYQEKGPTKKEIKEWFKGDKQQNIAILCGVPSANLVVLDFDDISIYPKLFGDAQALEKETLPFIPTEAEINQLIASCGKVVSIYLQGLKETGADPGEFIRTRWIDVNKEASTIAINHPVKGHNPRIIPVSAELIGRLETLPKTSERVFNVLNMYPNYYVQRKTAAKKFNNPRLLKITFVTLRHWKGTMEYHKTKDILHVMRLLGHKQIQNTLVYINLENAVFNDKRNDEFTVRVAGDVKEACDLVEAGFEYVTDMDEQKIFRKRK